MSCRSATSLSVFTGNHDQWSIFKAQFQSLIAQNSAFADVEKLTYLRNLLRGEALHITEQFPLTTSFAIVWASLVEHYDGFLSSRF